VSDESIYVLEIGPRAPVLLRYVFDRDERLQLRDITLVSFLEISHGALHILREEGIKGVEGLFHDPAGVDQSNFGGLVNIGSDHHDDDFYVEGDGDVLPAKTLEVEDGVHLLLINISFGNRVFVDHIEEKLGKLLRSNAVRIQLAKFNIDVASSIVVMPIDLNSVPLHHFFDIFLQDWHMLSEVAIFAFKALDGLVNAPTIQKLGLNLFTCCS
jgi:hypothetical protein